MILTTQKWIGLELDGGRYRILSLLNQGSMAELYLAQERSSGDQVVIKTPTAERMQALPDLATRFAVEMEAVRKLVHPSMLRVLHLGQHQGRPYFIMPFLAGGSLVLRMGTPSAQPGAALQSWLPSVAAALHHMHKQRCLHCNVKPTNILFNDRGQAVLADLGMAKILWEDGKASPNTILAGHWPGTPRYMAPEQLQRKPLDFRTDLFGLAVTVYEVITGVCPFAGDSPTEVHQAQQWQPLRPANELNPACPAPAAAVLQRALELDALKRYPSCHTFSTELLAALALPASPHSPTTLPRSNTTAEFEDFGIEVSDSDVAGFGEMAPVPDAIVEPAPRVYAPETVPQQESMSIVPVDSTDAKPWRVGRLLGYLATLFLLVVLLLLAAVGGSIFLPKTPLYALAMTHLAELDAPAEGAEKKIGPRSDDELQTLRQVAQQRETEMKSKADRLDDALTKLKEAEDNLQVTVQGKLNLGRQLDAARVTLNQEQERKRFAEKQRDQEVQRAVQAEDRARVAENKITGIEDSLRGARDDLDKIARTVKDKKLWWIVNNATDGTIYYESRVLHWNGEWSIWSKHTVEARKNWTMFSPPGCSWVQMRYNATIGAGKAAFEERQIHGQLFYQTENPGFGEIDPVYEFRYSANGREVHLIWLKR